MSHVDEVTVTMLQLGETVAEGTVTRWFKHVGETVAEGEALLEIATDKVDTEIPAPATGTVLEILVGEDATVPVGSVLARIGVGIAQAPGRRAHVPEVGLAGVGADRRPTPATGRRHAHSPRMRRLAESAGVDLDLVEGTGPGGRLVDADVLHAAAVSAPPPVAAPAPDAPAPTPSAPLGQTPRAAAILSAPAGPGAVTVVFDVDVTHLHSVADLDAALLSVVAAKAIPALRRCGAVNASTAPELAVNGQLIPGGGDLTVRALGQRITELSGWSADTTSTGRAQATHAPGNRVAVQGTPVPGATVLPALTTDCLCAIGVGGVRQGPVLLADPVHGPVLGIGALSTLTLSYDPAVLHPGAAAAYIAALRERLADQALGRELSG